MRVFDRGISPKAHFSMYVKSFMKKIKCFCYYSQSDKKWQSDSSSEACKKPIDSFYLTVNSNMFFQEERCYVEENVTK